MSPIGSFLYSLLTSVPIALFRRFLFNVIIKYAVCRVDIHLSWPCYETSRVLIALEVLYPEIMPLLFINFLWMPCPCLRLSGPLTSNITAVQLTRARFLLARSFSKIFVFPFNFGFIGSRDMNMAENNTHLSCFVTPIPLLFHQ